MDRQKVLKAFEAKNKLWFAKTGHTLFSPSQLSCFEKCPGAFWLADPDKKSEPFPELAELGTFVHKEIEYWFNHGKMPTNELANKIVNRYIDIFVNHYNYIADSDSELFLSSKLIPGLQGCCDVAGYRINEKKELDIFIIDFKTSLSFKYQAQDNLQLKAYAYMYLEYLHSYFLKQKYNKNVNIHSIIIQPNTHDGFIDRGSSSIYSDFLHHYFRPLHVIYETILTAYESPKDYIDHDNCTNVFCPAYPDHLAERLGGVDYLNSL